MKGTINSAPQVSPDLERGWHVVIELEVRRVRLLADHRPGEVAVALARLLIELEVVRVLLVRVGLLLRHLGVARVRVVFFLRYPAAVVVDREKRVFLEMLRALAATVVDDFVVVRGEGVVPMMGELGCGPGQGER